MHRCFCNKHLLIIEKAASLQNEYKILTRYNVAFKPLYTTEHIIFGKILVLMSLEHFDFILPCMLFFFSFYNYFLFYLVCETISI